MNQLDSQLKNMWFCGDVHSDFGPLKTALQTSKDKPSWIILLGDIEALGSISTYANLILKLSDSKTRLAFIHGNHDSDTRESWSYLHDDLGSAVALHGQVVNLNGVRVAGLGGTFLQRVWAPPNSPAFDSYEALSSSGGSKYRQGPRQPTNSRYLGAIYPSSFDRLRRERADVLVTHEAPHVHPFGWQAITDLAQQLNVIRSFHGHTHDDLTEQYKLQREIIGFDAVGVNYCSIKNGLGDIISNGPEGW